MTPIDACAHDRGPAVSPSGRPNDDRFPARREGSPASAARQLALRLLLAVATLLPFAPAAIAHSELRASQPADGEILATAPATIELQFSEPVQLTALTLVDAAGRRTRVALPADTTPRATERLPAPPLAPGAWRIEWRVISADGHPARGTVRFSVQP